MRARSPGLRGCRRQALCRLSSGSSRDDDFVIAYILARIVQGVVALLVLSLIVFLMARASGDPLQLLLPPNATREDQARVAHELGLDQPLAAQYFAFVTSLVKGDLGRSIRSGEPVSALLLQRAPASLELAAAALALIVCVGIPLGVISALRRGSAVDSG